MTKIRVLIADDAVVVRRLLANVIDADPDLEVVGVAQNGAIAVTKLEQLKPDIITLDIEMPVMDGLQALAEIRKVNRTIPIIMFSTLTERGGVATLEALSLGATDYVTKPANVGSVTAAMDRVRQDLIPKIKALCPRTPIAGNRLSAKSAGAIEHTSAAAIASRSTLLPPIRTTARPTGCIDVVAIGSSTGGPVALAEVIGRLPADLGVPVVITQHMPPVFTRLLAQRINATSAIEVREAADGDVLAPGLVLIAPGDHHLTLDRGAAAVTVRLTQSDPVNFCRPAVDVMFGSVAQAFGGDVLAVILTGMGHDGRDGCAVLKERGATVLAQDEATSVVWGMPGAVVQSALADEVCALTGVGPRIAQLVSGHQRQKVARR
ncbi:MAG: response regulator receiver modulated CheB methylesterase [Ilumatobacteraceae bacterium]|nr:response regulator receiver modulated CheB methylesterase [Ilumatobacteraceae bacterium]